MGRSSAQSAKPLLRPGRRITMESDGPIREPGHIAGKRLAGRKWHPDGPEQFVAHTAWLEIHQGRRPDIERETLAPIKPGAAARLTVRLEDAGRKPLRLQPRRRRQTGDP